MVHPASTNHRFAGALAASGETTHRRPGALAGAALLLAVSGCTAGSPSATPSPPVVPSTSAQSIPTASDSATPTAPAPTASPAASPTIAPITSSDATFNLLAVPQPADFASTITCDGPIGPSDPVAIVQLQAAVEGTGEVVLRDYANPATPRTACTFSQIRPVQLIDARHVVIDHGFDSIYAVVDLPEVRFHWFQLPGFVAVSPGLDQVLSLETYGDYEIGSGGTKVHVTTSAGDHVVASLPHPIGGRCGSPDDSKQGAYAHSGAQLFVMDQPIASYNSLLVVEGESAVLSVVPPSAGWPQGAHPAMAVWSPTSETVFYRQGSDVWQWTAGSNPERYLPGVTWLYPTITPDGGHLAYAVARADGLHDVYLVDLASGGNPQLIGEARNQPVFLNSTQLWYRSEGQGICGPSGDEPLIYNLTDASESPSVIDQVFGIWPATSSNH